MRLMERIRKHGDKGLKAFLVIFVISVFAGLGVGSYDFTQRAELERQAQVATGGAALDTAQRDVALLVNGRKVEARQFNEQVQRFSQMMRSQIDDPQMMLYVYGQTANTLIQEETLLGKAHELGIRVEQKDLAEERQKVIDAQGAVTQETTGNALGDLTKKLGSQRERKSLFHAALSRMGMTSEEWEVEMSRQIMLRKTREAIQEEANAAKDVEAKATRDLVDVELAKGVEFRELAARYSNAAESAKLGGDMTPGEDSWLLPGLLTDEINEDKNDITLFSTPKGEMTPWFDVPAGYQRWLVYDRVAVSDTEFESVKPKLEEQFKNEKGADYKPSDEELQARAFKIKARQIMINKTDPGAAQPKLEELYKSAKVEINNPYVLAYQALYDDKLQPTSSMDYDRLVAIASRAKVGENYNFEAIKGKLERGKPQTAAPVADAETADDAEEAAATTETDQDNGQIDSLEEAAQMMDAAASGAASSAGAAASGTETESGADTAAQTADSTPSETPEDPAAPIYALGIGLLELALEGSDEASSSPFSQAIIAKVYLDWIAREDDLKGQPLDRQNARLEIETRLARAVGKDDYNAGLFADQGLNLAWLDKTDEAKVALEKAEKYASDTPGGPLEVVKQAYEKLDMQDKVKAIDEKLNTARQRQLQEQIQQQMALQQQQAASDGSSASAPINIDLGGQ